MPPLRTIWFACISLSYSILLFGTAMIMPRLTSQGGLGFDWTGNGTNNRGQDGAVIIAYASSLANLVTIGGGLTYTLDTTSRSGYKVYTFTAGTGTVSW